VTGERRAARRRKAPGVPLATRLVVPHRPPDLLHRRRLVDALSAAAELPLALVAAPAGAGKSSLIGDWVRAGAAPGPVAWVGLDGEAVGRSEFWTLVFAAVEGALGDPGAFAKQGPVDPALVAFLNRLADEPRPVVLVLDDFQEVLDDAVAADLDALLQHPPPALRVLIASRRDPPLRLGRLRVGG
jgi:LuxR family transcriptional regulator, maltose regulon positive regulatory protein